MKLSSKIYAPLEQNYYTAKIIKFTHMETEHEEGYTECLFTLPNHPERGEQKMNIFPNQLEFVLGALVGQTDIGELTDSTEPLHGKTVQLFYSHSYNRYDKDTKQNTTVYKKQWQVYKGN